MFSYNIFSCNQSFQSDGYQHTVFNVYSIRNTFLFFKNSIPKIRHMLLEMKTFKFTKKSF